jgi:hypothetical protein
MACWAGNVTAAQKMKAAATALARTENDRPIPNLIILPLSR